MTYDPVKDAWTIDATPPPAYAQSLESIAPNINSLVAENKTDSESWTDALIRLLPAVAATWQQKQLLEVQVERAKQGLPPLNANQIAAGVNVGIAPESQKLIMWAIGGLVLALVIPAFLRARR